MIEELKTKTDEGEPFASPLLDADGLQAVATNVCLIALCVIASLASFWDVKLTFDHAVTVGWLAILLYLVATTVYNTKYDGGVYKGRQTEAYKTANEDFYKLRDQISDQRLTDDLRDWCNDFRVKERDNLRKNIICPYMRFDTYLDMYENLSRKEVKKLPLSKKVKQAINTANQVEPVDITADKLLNLYVPRRFFKKRKILPISGDDQRRGDIIVNYVKRFFLTFVCGMFIVEVVSSPSLDTFLQWIIRMIPIVMAFLTAPAGGFRNATEVSVKRLNAQSKLLKTFLADRVALDEEKKALPADVTGDSTPNVAC
jgi:hypothetical protein